MPRRRPEFGSGSAGAEAAKLKKFSDAGGSQIQWLPDAGKNQFLSLLEYTPMKEKAPNPELVSNRKAGYDYEILETFEAGIVLLGSEIKSLRNHGGSLQDAFVSVRGDITLMNASIAPYSHGGVFNHEERRPRKLLLHKREIANLQKLAHEKGLAVIPLSIFLNKKGIAKVRIALAKGKKAYDKRASLKEKEDQRAIQRALDE